MSNFRGQVSRLFCDAENYKDALKDFQKAAYDGYADAQSNLGGMYFSGLGIAKNDNEALIWYRKAAEQGHANAQNSLGSMYFNGQGLAKDDIQALTWYRKAAEQGHANAQYSMGWMYENGVAVAKDDACAANWYQKSADQGHAWAQNNLGTLYFSGQGVAKDEKRAFGWYQEAANQGHADAQSSIGAMYFNGQGVAKDDTQAFSWYRKAADQGLVGAQYSIGWMYENGIGTTLDTTQAVEWYKKAAAQGQADAQAAVSRLMGMVAQTHSGPADRKLAVNNTETRAVQGANRFVAGQPWTNSLGVKFVPAGTDGVLFSVWDVRVKDFKAFVDATGYDLDTWKSPGFRQTEDHPVVRVTWYDAKAYCDWLTKKEQTEGKLGPNQKYRLPTDMEWSRAVGLNESAGGTPKSKDPSRFINPFYKYIFPWGTQWPPPKGAGNYAESLTQDGYIYTSPVGSFTANQYGLYDMGGNVWQMCECKYDGESEHRVVRGGAYYLVMETQLDSRNRCCTLPDHRDEHQGFRVVLLV